MVPNKAVETSRLAESFSHIVVPKNKLPYFNPDRQGFLTPSQQDENILPIRCNVTYCFHYRIIILFCLIIFSIPSSLFAEEMSLNLSPLYYQRADESKGLKQIEILGSLFRLKFTHQERNYSLKPLFNFEEDIAKKEKTVEVLWPLGKYQRTEKKKEGRFLPFYYSKYETLEDSREIGTSMFLPLYIGGETEKGKYHLFFPFYGTLKSWFTKDEMRIFLFPLYIDSVKENDKSREVLWPIFHYAKGEKHTGYRFWPIYGFDKIEGKHLKTFYLWPLVNYQKIYEGDKLVKKRFISLPFYGFQESDGRNVEAILFPLYVHDKSRTQKYNRYDIIWPIFSLSYGEGRQIKQFFPLFRFDKRGNTTHDIILWPLFWFDRVSSDGYERRVNRFAPLFEDRKETWTKEEKKGRSISLWPIISYDRDREDNVKISVPSLVSFLGHERFRERMEENYSYLWTLYKYERDKEGNSASTLFWKLFKDEKKGSERSIEIPLIFSYTKNEKGNSFSLLKGFLERKNEGEKSRWKILYIPFSQKSK